MKTHKYQDSGWRPDLTPYKKIIDIGGANSFAHGKLDAVIDIRQPQADAKHKFIGNIDEPAIWDDVMEVAVNEGLWDYAICTHTLEDINNPMYALRMITTIATAGFIAVPSKYRELSRFSDPVFRGYIHHRWIYDVQDNSFIAYPKINYIEHPYFDSAVNSLPGQDELIIEWDNSNPEHRLKYTAINDGMPYGTETLSGEDHIRQLYKNLLR